MSDKLLRLLAHPGRIPASLGHRGLLNWLGDEPYLKLLFRCQMGFRLNLEEPRTFSEKLQWLKLHDRDPRYCRMVDKFDAKAYVSQRIGPSCIVPTYGVWDRFEDIDFDALPNAFVLKCTHDSGGLVICRDKAALDRDAARQKIRRSLKRNYYYPGREWPYKDLKPRIIAEALLAEDAAPGSLVDYKFYCFHGEPRFLYISQGLENHDTAAISFLTLDWQFAPFARSDYRPFAALPPKPKTYETMLSMARELSRGIPFLRVDLYEVDGQVYFSELTFFPNSGMVPLEPPQADRELGDLLTLK